MASPLALPAEAWAPGRPRATVSPRVRVLVTGARGFLGRRVVIALRTRGHQVRALDVSASAAGEGIEVDGVEQLALDLCCSPDLDRACDGMQAVIHLAARMQGDDDEIIHSAVEGTRRLLEAMDGAGVGRMVLASSLSVYDWAEAAGVLDEESPLERHPELRDAYTLAKTRQEQLARERCVVRGVSLTVLRPGVIWGTGREFPPTIGQRLGAVHLVVGASRQLPTVHADNCADAFAAVLEGPSGEGAFNVIDHPDVTVGRFVRDHLRFSGRFGLVVPVPYRLGLAGVTVVHRLTPGPLRRRLPSFVAPARFLARYKPVHIEGAKFRAAFGWHPPFSYAECLGRTYGRAVP